MQLRDAVRTALDLGDAELTLKHRPEKMSGAAREFYEARTNGHRFFVKYGVEESRTPEGLIRALSELPPPSYRSPRFICHTNMMEIWEYVDGTSKALTTYSREEIDELMLAIATAETAVVASDIRQTYWMRPVAGLLRKVAETAPEFAAFRSHISVIARLEAELIDRCAGDCLTHNDLHSFNIMRTDKGYCLVDWESASLGPAGASLRIFADWKLEERKFVAERYSRHKKKLGAPIGVDEVLFAMHAHQAYWALHSGVRKKNTSLITRGWRHFQKISRI